MDKGKRIRKEDIKACANYMSNIAPWNLEVHQIYKMSFGI
jgi:hypothetical protein